MDLSDKNYLLIIVGILLITAEIIMGAATGFDLLLTGIILIISGGMGIFTGSFTYSLFTISVLALIYLLIGRRYIKKQLFITTKATNIDSIIGKKGVVIKAIAVKHPGQVKIDGEIWRAESDKAIEDGSEIIADSVSGVTLKVHAIS